MTVRGKSHWLFFTLHILIPLLAGTAIYLWLRPDLDISRVLEGLAGRIQTMPTFGSANPAASSTFPSILSIALIELRNNLPAALSPWTSNLPASLSALQTILPDGLICALRNFGSDILWAYALTAALAFILGTRRRSVILSVTIAAALGALLEAAQLTGLINGTFDPLDILFETAAALAAASIIHLIHHGGKYETLLKNTEHHPDHRHLHSICRRFVLHIQVQGDQSNLDR